jgi:hypothetical protein
LPRNLKNDQKKNTENFALGLENREERHDLFFTVRTGQQGSVFVKGFFTVTWGEITTVMAQN